MTDICSGTEIPCFAATEIRAIAISSEAANTAVTSGAVRSSFSAATVAQSN
ncbi:hypothetical protein D3C76_1547140 [compost metagenome]